MAFLLPKLSLFFFIMLQIPSANSDFTSNTCSNDANYTANSTFQSNLNLLLPSLSAAATPAGYSNEAEGRSPDQVFGLALCRGDITPNECQNCLNTSIQDFLQLCPKGKRAAIWHEKCMLRYSDQNFFSMVDTSFRLVRVNTANSSDPARFNEFLGQLIGRLITRATQSSDRMFATGEADYTSSVLLYGLVQCTRDLSDEMCRQCLQGYFGYIPDCCKGTQGAMVVTLSCSVRFEMYPFYNLTADDLSSPLPPPPSGKDHKWITVLAVVIPITGVLVLSCVIYAFFKRRRILRRKNYGQDEDEITTSRIILFDLSTLRDATDNFSDENKLGQGGFGPVYKGLLSDGQQIAVKRLSRSSRQGIIELRNEVDLVAKLQHKNLVILLGFCLGEQEKLLVYEYLPNGSLDNFLFGNRSHKIEQLDWRTRYKIILGIGRGLLYLHEDSRLKIIHRDLKASNILLDGDMNPKISDFGLASLFGVNETQRITSRLAGTYGYMPPEYVQRKQFSTSSDVFSFGVLVLEIVIGRRNRDFDDPDSGAGLLSHVWQHWNEEKVLELVDQSVVKELEQVHQVLRCIHIGLLCVQDDPTTRPNMASVVLMLSTHLIAAPSPSVPGFCQPERVLIPVNNIPMKASSSVNNISMTEMQPR